MKPAVEIKALTGLRGAAVLWVVALHYTVGAGWTGQGFWFDLAAVGNAGVVVFFLLSGFIMSHVYATAWPGFGRFMWTRIARIYPLHLFTLIAWGIIGWRHAHLSPYDTPFTFALNLLLVQAWGFTPYMTWNALSWTISIELFCYLLFPLALRFARGTAWWSAAVLGMALLAIFYVPYGMLLNALGLQLVAVHSFGFYLPHFAAMFLAGVALQHLMPWLQRNVPPLAFDAALIGGLLVVLANAHPPLWDWRIAIGTLLIIAALSTGRGLGAVLFGNPVMFFLGEISYAIYLTHGMIHFSVQLRYPTMPAAAIAAITIAIAIPVYYLIERPARAALRRLASSPAAAPLHTSALPASLTAPLAARDAEREDALVS